MSLIRQIVWLLVAVVLLALLGSVSINVLAARETLQSQLRLKNADNAAALAVALSQQKGDATAMELLVSAQFDTGYYRRIALVAADGKALVERQAAARASDAPAWFVGLLAIDAPAGVSQVSDGWRSVGTLSLESQSAYAYDALWAGALRTSGWLALVGLASAVLAVAGVGAVRRPLDATVAQAAALQEGRFITVAEPRVPELRTLVIAMNALVEKLRSVFDAQARQVDDLRRQAELDPLSGLFNRRYFVARLGAALGSERGGDGGALVLLRLRDLDGLNRRHGRAMADRLLGTVAQALAAYPERVEGGFAGRLNGADFALYLPARAVAAETAQALVAGLQAVLPGLAGEAAVWAGAAELAGGQGAGAALAAVDDALARAEAEGPFGVALHGGPEDASVPVAEDEWRQRIDAALGAGRASLVSYPVVDRTGALVHLECPLRLQLDEGGAPVPAAQWLSHALRSRRIAALDLQALRLALAASQADGRARSVNVALDSLNTAGFVADLGRVLRAQPAAARHLLLELPERALLESRALLQDAARHWSERGASVGIEHAGGAVAELGRLYELGLDFVKIDRRHVEGVASDAGVRQFASSLVTLLRGMRLKVIAEGVQSSADLQALWDLGFDGATGPAVAPAG